MAGDIVLKIEILILLCVVNFVFGIYFFTFPIKGNPILSRCFR
jgi:hypothetical protein